jgi:hypothetical protein
MRPDEDESADRSPVDAAIANTLTRKFGMLSRRAFLSVATRKVLSLAGVAVASEVLPFLASDAYAAEPTWCGLHGWICGTGNCSGGSRGVGASARWVQCCQTGCGIYQCISYWDRCSTTTPPPASGCQGVSPPAGYPPWCGSDMSLKYVCTEVEPIPTQYPNAGYCASACQGLPVTYAPPC